MQAQGNDEKKPRRTLDADGWQTFWRVTLPNIRWALLYGVLLCNARDGRVRRRGLRRFGPSAPDEHRCRCISKFLQRLQFLVVASAVASLLALLAIVTLIVKSFLEWQFRDQLRRRAQALRLMALEIEKSPNPSACSARSTMCR